MPQVRKSWRGPPRCAMLRRRRRRSGISPAGSGPPWMSTPNGQSRGSGPCGARCPCDARAANAARRVAVETAPCREAGVRPKSKSSPDDMPGCATAAPAAVAVWPLLCSQAPSRRHADKPGRGYARADVPLRARARGWRHHAPASWLTASLTSACPTRRFAMCPPASRRAGVQSGARTKASWPSATRNHRSCATPARSRMPLPRASTERLASSPSEPTDFSASTGRTPVGFAPSRPNCQILSIRAGVPGTDI